MKTRFKIIVVIACFVIFYVVLIPLHQLCMESRDDCIATKELMLLTRMTVYSGDVAWSGTTGESVPPSAMELLEQNISFIVSMIVLPFVIIGLIVSYDRTSHKTLA